MDSTLNAVSQPTNGRTPPYPRDFNWVIWGSVAANLLLIVGCVLLAITVINLPVEDFGNLGKPVQGFLGLIALLPAVLGIYSSLGLLRQSSQGTVRVGIGRIGIPLVPSQGTARYIALTLQFAGIVGAGIVLLNLWGFFLGYEGIVDGIVQNGPLTLGFAIAYGLWWLAGRMDDANPLKAMLDRLAIAIGMITLIALLWFSNVLGIANLIIGSYANPLAWAATGVFIVLGYLAWRLLHFGELFGELPGGRAAWQGWLMLSPNIIGFMIFFAGPLLLSLYLSFTNSSVGQIPEVIGLQNYGEILSLEFQWQDDPTANMQSVMTFGYSPLGALNIGGRQLVVGARDTLFWWSLRNTILFCFLLVPLSTIPALFLSMVLNSKLPGVKFFRAIYFLPSVAAVVGTALIWRWLYDPTIGFFNYIISGIVDFFSSIGITIADPQISWLTDPNVVLFSIVFLAAWQVVGFNTVLFLVGLQGIPDVLYEAAQIDGANRWQMFRNVTFPLLRPTTFFVVITTVITGLQVFNEPYALLPSRPIPINATTSVYYLYNRGFFRFEFGYASAIAWLLFILIFTITFIQFRVQRSGGLED